MTDPREIEAKFEADATAWEILRTLDRFGDFMLIERQNKQQDDRYYDTADERLKDAGASLRIRRSGSKSVVTFKGSRAALPSGDQHVVSRLEDEVEVASEAIETLDDRAALVLAPEPSPVRRARELSNGADLFPAARLLTQRAQSTFENTSGERVEIAMDRARAVRLSDGREVTFVEIEVELKQGDASALELAANSLQQAVPGIVPSTRTKLERALGG